MKHLYTLSLLLLFQVAAFPIQGMSEPLYTNHGARTRGKKI